jgi:hypothetical protein
MWKSVTVSALLVALLPATAAATDETPAAVPSLKFERALGKIDQKVAKLMGNESQQALRLMAEAAVLSDYCAAVNLDQRKFKQEFDALTTGSQQRTVDEQRKFENLLAMYFGTYVGVLVAEGTDRRGEFCGFAEDALKSQRPISRFWLTTNSAMATPKP